MSVHRTVVITGATGECESYEIRMIRAVENTVGAARWDEAMSGWQSNFVAAPTQLLCPRSDLDALVGRSLREGWIGWDPVSDLRQPGLPLVLVFDSGVQLELAWQGWDELSITWNTIDLLTPPVVVGKPHEWRSSQPRALAAVAGRVLTGWAVTEEPYFDGEADLTGELPMDAVKGWFAQGLLMQFAGIDLHVYSGADTTLISAGYEVPARLAHQQLQEDAA